MYCIILIHYIHCNNVIMCTLITLIDTMYCFNTSIAIYVSSSFPLFLLLYFPLPDLHDFFTYSGPYTFASNMLSLWSVVSYFCFHGFGFFF